MNSGLLRSRIERFSSYRAFISLTAEDSAGSAVAVKDVIDVAGTVTTAGSIILPPSPAPTDAHVVKCLRRGGHYVIGKANLHEFALGATSENPHHGPVLNPVDSTRVAGGSSGGSASAVALGLCDWAIGTDTGGSIRIPAALCGVVGFKPTVGTVDTDGVFPVSPTLDTVGPMALDVSTVTQAFADMTSHAVSESPGCSFKSLRMGFPAGWGQDLHPLVQRAWDAAIAELLPVSLPPIDRLRSVGEIIVGYEAARVHEQWLEQCPELYGPDVLSFLRKGSRIAQVTYSNAVAQIPTLRADVEQAMEGLDAILAPATRIVAPLLGAPYRPADLTAYTRPFSTTGHPAIVLPLPGYRFPVGVQIIGHFGQDSRLLEVAHAVEETWNA